jgi:hypothetical protein
VIGGFAHGKDKRGKWALIDLDNHDGFPDVAAANEQYAIRPYAMGRDLGLCALLVTWGGGSFHLWVLFDRAVPAAFGNRPVHDHAEFGFDKPLPNPDRRC